MMKYAKIVAVVFAAFVLAEVIGFGPARVAAMIKPR
jgi:hypothetical protein